MRILRQTFLGIKSGGWSAWLPVPIVMFVEPMLAFRILDPAATFTHSFDLVDLYPAAGCGRRQRKRDPVFLRSGKEQIASVVRCGVYILLYIDHVFDFAVGILYSWSCMDFCGTDDAEPLLFGDLPFALCAFS